MDIRRLRVIGVLCCALLLSACVRGDEGELHTRLLLWHSSEAIAPALERIIDEFEVLNPGVTVVVQIVPEPDLRERYIATALLGLGPDILIGSSQWISELADDNLIREIGSFNLPTDVYLSASLENVRYGDGIYGVPFSLEPLALYYNTALVEAPPETLDEMLAQATAGRVVGLGTEFSDVFWGMQALGGRLFDEQGRVVLDQGGFASWLNWLEQAQRAPGMILSRDKAELLRLFTESDIAYYAGGPEDLPVVREALGDEGFRVAPLPAGTGGPSGPLLNVDAMMFNLATSESYTEIALALAAFLTNDVQSSNLLSTRSFVPANRRVQANSRLYPGIAGFLTQARTAVSIPNTDAMQQVFSRGDTLLQQVLFGVTSSTEAATILAQEVNASAGFVSAAVGSQRCEHSGDVAIWHSLEGDMLTAVEAVTADYAARCPDVLIRLVHLTATAQIVQGFQSVAGTNAAPDALLVPSTELIRLADAELLHIVEADVTQRYVPSALNILRYQNMLLGLPVALHFQALYYNTTAVADPAVTLDDLLTAAQSGTGVALPVGFLEAYWGAPAFGTTIFDEDGRVVLDQGGYSDWLTWLQKMAELPSVVAASDEIARAAFVSGDAAYYVGSTAALPTLIAELGAEEVGVALLPAGPAGPSAPFMTTTAFLISARDDAAAVARAFDFGLFLTDTSSQTMLADMALQVPANVTVTFDENTKSAVMLRQALQVTVLPNIPERMTLLQLADPVVRSVLEDGASPVEAVNALAEEVNRENGFEPRMSPAASFRDSTPDEASMAGESGDG